MSYKLPLTNIIWKMLNLFHFQVREVFNDLYFQISKVLYNLNLSAQLDTFAVCDGGFASSKIYQYDCHYQYIDTISKFFHNYFHNQHNILLYSYLNTQRHQNDILLFHLQLVSLHIKTTLYVDTYRVHLL